MPNKLRTTLLSTLLVVLTACGRTGEPLSNASSTASAPTPAASALPTPTLATTPRDILDLGNEALAKQDSFRMRLTFTYDGTDTGGEPQKGEVSLVNELWLNATKDRHLSLSEQDLLTADAIGMGMFQLGGKTYVYSRDDTRGLVCSRLLTDMPAGAKGLEQNKAIFQPNLFIAGIKGARMVERGVPINGVLTDHYVFDRVDFGTFTSVKGDVWLAQGENQSAEFIVRYTGEAIGKSNPAGRELSGSIKWDYQIEDVNQVPATQLVDACTTIQMGLPIPDHADVRSNSLRSLTFNAPDSVADLAAFFRNKLAAAGWTLEASSPVLSDMWNLDFSQGSTNLQVRISGNREGSSVMIDRVESPDTVSYTHLTLPTKA